MKTTKRKSKTVTKSAPVAEERAVAPVVTLASHCTIKDAGALKLDLCAVADEAAEIVVDVGAVERIDTSTMQLLCAFARGRLARDHKILWNGDSQHWRDAVRLLGVAALLGIPPSQEETSA